VNEGLISKRYAKALYEHAYNLGEEAVLYHRMQILEMLWRRMPDLRTSLISPIPVGTKIGLLKNATGKNAEQSYLDFIDLVIANHREEYVLMIALSYQMIYRKKKRISVVHLISSKRLPTQALNRLRSLTEDKTHGKVELHNRIDPSIQGGFIYQLNDLRIDASVKGQLDRITRQLTLIGRSII
jgi:F-type H+-transporting ATPase subunit delta